MTEEAKILPFGRSRGGDMSRVSDMFPRAVTARSDKSQARKYDLVPLAGPPVMAPKPTGPVCPICKGAGRVRYSVEPTHPDWAKDKLCECKMAEFKMKSIPDGYRDYSFDTFPSTVDQVALQVAKAFAKRMTAVKGLWLYNDDTGTGKTGLACCILKYAIEHGDAGRHVRATKFYEQANGVACKTEDADALHPYYSTPWLVVDDIGAESSTKATLRHTLDLLEERRGKYTVFTSNYSYEAICDRWRAAGCNELDIRRVIDRLGEQYYPQKVVGKIRQRCY